MSNNSREMETCVRTGDYQRFYFRTASHSLYVSFSDTPYVPATIKHEPTGNFDPPPSSTMPAPSVPITGGSLREEG